LEKALKAANLLDEVRVSSKAGELIDIAQELGHNGYRKFLILGGDGTAHEVLHGLMSSDDLDAREFKLAMMSVGTGNDWMRTIGLPGDMHELLETLKKPEFKQHDAGLIHFEDGTPSRYFLNIAGAGFDGKVTADVASRRGFLAGSRLSYWWSIFTILFSYRHTKLTVKHSSKTDEFKALTLAAGICRYNGGGMMQLPQASFQDGLLDVSIIGHMSTLAMVYHLPKMLDGSFVKLDVVRQYRANRIRIESDPAIWVEADGEILGKTPVDIECIPNAFQVLIPKSGS
jgi:YegS/Rv2252/BmrU family lipid kinase